MCSCCQGVEPLSRRCQGFVEVESVGPPSVGPVNKITEQVSFTGRCAHLLIDISYLSLSLLSLTLSFQCSPLLYSFSLSLTRK
jgi:hypothetical protein